VTRIFRYLPLLALFVCSIQLASAQSTFDFAMGFGAAQDKAGTSGFDGLTLSDCNSTTVYCAKTNSLSGFTMGFGGNLMLWKHFGLGANVNFQPAKETYAAVPAITYEGQQYPSYNVQSRVTLYSFDGTFQPVSSKKAALQVIGGVGGANTKFYVAQSSSSTALGNINSSQYFNSANHFQVHGGVAVQYYISGNFFIRPEFDFHYIPNFTQFGSNIVTSESVWIGYSFGNR
jgi:hypothetical protein